MDAQFAKNLCELNSRFYAEQSESFSATRASSWEGWARVVDVMGVNMTASCMSVPLKVLDVACGNLRFEAYLSEECASRALSFTALDNCDALLPEQLASSVDFVHCDVMDTLQQGRALPVDAGAYSLAASFGFMHHVPLPEWRVQLLSQLIEAVHPSGTIAVSFWRFASNAALAEKAQATTTAALEYLGWQDRAGQLEPGDYLVGWQNKPGVYRYCHSFTDVEIDALAQAASDQARIIDRFRADGRTHDLNEYLVLQKR